MRTAKSRTYAYLCAHAPVHIKCEGINKQLDFFPYSSVTNEWKCVYFRTFPSALSSDLFTHYSPLQKATLPLHGIPRSIEDDNGEEMRMERGERRRSLGRIFTGPKRRQLPEHCEISGPFLDIPSFLPLAPARAWKWGKEGHSGMAIGGQGGEEGGRPKK